jgi:hypothetical protein
MISQQEKDRIDYEIEAKSKAKEKEYAEWAKALFWGIIALIILTALFH